MVVVGLGRSLLFIAAWVALAGVTVGAVVVAAVVVAECVDCA